MEKLLIVDDEDQIRTLLKKHLVLEGYEIYEAINGMDAIEENKKENFSLIIVDVMMPELDGFSTVREIRKTSNIPIIMLSARSEEYDRIHGFELGVDDYIVKPFSPREVVMRVQAVLKRSNAEKLEVEDKKEVFIKDELTVDFTARKVLVNGNNVELSPKEYDLIFYLVKNRNIALSRDKILNDVWGEDFFGYDRTLDTHIKLLRKSLSSCARFIVTIRGVGYRFEG
ncbi:response regulator transcription factor [uncultured Clostridium sp.]|uniref:response regulator transcription factor n=1 Tax=uncultured Clostridium sp. TaxID=59620 RepID=UPI0032176956